MQPSESAYLWEPSMDPCEWPEARNYYSKDELDDFVKQAKKQGLEKARPITPISLPDEAQKLLFCQNTEQGLPKNNRHSLNGTC